MKTKTLVMYALFAAIILVLSMTPIGYLKIGFVEISFMMIPVAVGAIVMGPVAGAIFGAIFGLTSFGQAIGGSPFGAALMSVSPVMTFILCLIPRILAGYLCGLTYQLLKKKNNAAACLAASVAAPVLNTVLFTGLLILMFGNSDYIANMRAGKNVLAFAAAFVGINGLCEAAASIVISMPVALAVNKAIKK